MTTDRSGMTGHYLGDPWTTPIADLLERARAQNAWESLDRVFVERVLASMLEAREPLPALRNALHDATTASGVPAAFVDRWATLLDLVLRAAERPSTSNSLTVLAGTDPGRDVFRLLADATVQLQSLAHRLGLSDPLVGKLVDQLEQAGLARRIRLGQAVVVQLTPHGQLQVKHHQPAPPITLPGCTMQKVKRVRRPLRFRRLPQPQEGEDLCWFLDRVNAVVLPNPTVLVAVNAAIEDSGVEIPDLTYISGRWVLADGTELPNPLG